MSRKRLSIVYQQWPDYIFSFYTTLKKKKLKSSITDYHELVIWHLEMHENWNTHNHKNEKYRKLLRGTLVNQTRTSWHLHLSGSHLLWAQWQILKNITLIIIYRCWVPGFNDNSNGADNVVWLIHEFYSQLLCK